MATEFSESMLNRCSREWTLRPDDPLSIAAYANALSTVHEAQRLIEMQPGEFIRHILTRATQEPKHGICDSVACRPALINVTASQKLTEVMVPFQHSMIVSTKPSTIGSVKIDESLIKRLHIATPGKESEHDTSASPLMGPVSRTRPGTLVDKAGSFLRLSIHSIHLNPDRKEYRQVLGQPLSSSISEWKNTTALPKPSIGYSKEESSQTTDNFVVLWPVILVELKKTKTIDEALHQLYTYMVSAIDMYSSIGLNDHPVWGVFTNGAVGGVLLGWRSAKTGVSTDIRHSLPIPCANLHHSGHILYKDTFARIT